jgi:hypothetical protein
MEKYERARERLMQRVAIHKSKRHAPAKKDSAEPTFAYRLAQVEAHNIKIREYLSYVAGSPEGWAP